MTTVEVAKPPTNLNRLHQKDLVELLKAGYTAEQIEQMEAPDLVLEAHRYNLFFPQYKEFCDHLKTTPVKQISAARLKVTLDAGVDYDELTFVVEKLERSKPEEAKSNWIEASFVAYCELRALEDGPVARGKLIALINKQIDLCSYLILRKLGCKHLRAEDLIQNLGTEVTVLAKSRAAGINDEDMLDFLENSANPGSTLNYIKLRTSGKSACTHAQAMEVLNSMPYVEMYLGFRRYLPHADALPLAIHSATTRVFLERKGSENARTDKIEMSKYEVVDLLQLPPEIQALVIKLMEWN